MRPSFLLTLALVLWGCSPSALRQKRLEDLETFNLEQGLELAVSQDSLLARYERGESASPRELLSLRNNQWVKTAQYLAPSNLILRQWGLFDLFSGTPAHADQILSMMELLSAGSSIRNGCLWEEGYSYWLYTRSVMAPWAEAFGSLEAGMRLKVMIDAIDLGFAMTAYPRDSVWYPAPFGDLRAGPLSGASLNLRAAMTAQEPKSCGFVNVEAVPGGYKYGIAAHPVGLNTHIPVGILNVDVVNGAPLGFHYYRGYDTKYASAAEERADMLRPERVASLELLHLRERFQD